MLNGIQLGPHGHGDVSLLRQGSIGGPYGTFGPGELLPGRGGGAMPASADATQAAQHVYDLQHRGAAAGDIQNAAVTLAQLLRRRGGRAQAAAAGGKPAAPIGGRPYLP